MWLAFGVILVCIFLFGTVAWRVEESRRGQVFQLVSISLLTPPIRARLNDKKPKYKLTSKGVSDAGDPDKLLRSGEFTDFGTYHDGEIERIVTASEGTIRVREDGVVAHVHCGWVSCGPHVYPVGPRQVVEWFGPYLVVEDHDSVYVYDSGVCLQVLHPSRPVSAIARLDDMMVLVGEKVSFFTSGRDTVELYRTLNV